MYPILSATRGRSGIAVLARVDGRVRTWSLEPLRELVEFQTIFGGVLGRLAVATTPDRDMVAAAASWRGAVAGYDARSGERLWERRDFREIRHLAAASGGRHFTASFDRGPMQILDVHSGETIASVRGIRAVYAGSHAALAVVAYDGRVALGHLDPWRFRARLDLAGFGVLDAEFGSDVVLVSVVQDPDEGPSSVYQLSTDGAVMWRYESPPRWNVPWLGRDQRSGHWLGVEHDPEQSVEPGLIRWSDDGTVTSRHRLPGAADFAFVSEGRRLIATPGIVLDTATGDMVERFDAG